MHAKWADVVGQQQAGSKEAKGIIGAAGEAGAAVEGIRGAAMAAVWICVAAFYHLYNFVSPSL